MGSTKMVSIRGFHYYVTFTRKLWVHFTKEKSEVFTHFLSFKAMVQKEKGAHMKFLSSEVGKNTSM